MTEQDARDRYSRYLRRYASLATTDLSSAVNASWQRLTATGDWAGVHKWLDRLHQLAQESFE